LIDIFVLSFIDSNVREKNRERTEPNIFVLEIWETERAIIPLPIYFFFLITQYNSDTHYTRTLTSL